MRILITGAGSQLAQALLSIAELPLCHKMAEHTATQRLLINLLPEAKDCVSANDVVKGFFKEQLDICCVDSIRIAFEQFKPDFVVNCAAYNAVDLAEIDSEHAIAINENGPKLLAQECLVRKIKLVHISTDFVFNGQLSRAYNELDATSPLSAYGKSKLNGEFWVNQILGSDASIIRTSWLYSCRGNNFVKTMQRLFAVKDELSVINDQTGSPTWCEALAVVIFQLLKQLGTSCQISKELGMEQGSELITATVENIAPNLYHYAASGSCTWFEFAKQIQQQMNVHFSINSKERLECKLEPISTDLWQSWHQHTLAKRPAQSALCADKIRGRLAFREQSLLFASWELQLQAMLQYQAAIKI
ncbi:dTDP-4-dehydrorhamnose reductase [Shewanella sp. 1CM18E]|uniref:dTDP-4-dehydrorhamnose reductase n=1 Tax=Shewanella sp. 1CM18E TaxID=2929169 RepID=UPI0020BDBF9F|nr:dTDP-4-dehydrorhamnose reductase [Shewanella sp. 1CM18E]